MTQTFTLDIVTPSALLASKQVTMAVVPGSEGQFGVLAKHAPVISSLKPGVIDLYEGGKVTERVFTAGGFVEVTPERCIVLATEALNLKNISSSQAQERFENAETALRRAQDDATRKKAEREAEIAAALKHALQQ